MRIPDIQKKRIVDACARGLRIESVAAQFEISPSSVDRVLREARARGEAASLRRGRPTKRRAATQPITAQVVDERSVDEVYAQISKLPFPYPEPLAPEQVARQIARLRALATHLDRDEIRPWDAKACRLCSPFFPNRFSARYRNGLSAFEGWHDESILKKAIRFQIKHGDPIAPHRVVRAVTLICRTPSVFRPSVAQFIYRRYAAPEQTVWDPCAGFGGRLVGAHAAGVRYIATEVDEATVDGNRRLAETIGSSAELHHTPAEEFEPPAVDLVFTSPPYFNREQYSHGRTQSWRRHGADFRTWLDGFLRPVAERAHRALRPGGHLVLNVADLRERSAVIPIVSETVAAARALDFVHVETLRMPLSPVNRNSPSEPVLVFRKS